MPNTEKPTTIAEKKKTEIVKTSKKQPVPKVVENKKEETKTTEKEEPKKPAQKKPIQSKPKVKRDYAIVNAKDVPISTKHSIAICRFIKNKNIEKAIEGLGKVLIKKKAIPMKGEIPHRKGKIMSGRYPQKAVGHFIKLLKSLESNSNINELNEPVIVEAISNLAQRPYGRFGRTKKKRTKIKIKCVALPSVPQSTALLGKKKIIKKKDKEQFK